ncbi:MAG: RNase adapter RapZ [Acidobacteria bacterium]|nr:RNase adapter RapZ [Acidobacteriota bacterium]
MPKKSPKSFSLPSLVIITGLSGSGMSSATDSLEDLGYFCVDNLPLTLLSTFGRLLRSSGGRPPSIDKAALVINIRERQFLAEFPDELKKLTKKGPQPFVVFFEASDDVLLRRFSETRRPHPADDGKGLSSAIRRERLELRKIRKLADLIIDTSEQTVHSLRRLIHQKFTGLDEGIPLKIEIQSFGHKFGGPRGVDLLFDVRHLPNPYFQPTLREFSGEDKAVVDFLSEKEEVKETIDRFIDLLLYLVPKYKREGKSYLNIGIGCTGGRHRSVMVANAIAERLIQSGFDAAASHRDISN